MTNQPHIHQLGAFDPAQAFGRTFLSFAQLVEGAKETPDCLPANELLRAGQAAIDMIEAIAELTIESLAGQLATCVSSEEWSDHRLEVDARRAARGPEEDMAFKMALLSKWATFIPHEVDIDPDDE
jgi:hypothetical protein